MSDLHPDDRLELKKMLERIQIGIRADARVRVTNAIHDWLLSELTYEEFREGVLECLVLPEGISRDPDFSKLCDYIDEIIIEKFERYKAQIGIVMFPRKTPMEEKR